MLRHIFNLMWKRKSKNAFLILEIAVAFFALFCVLSFVFTFLNKYRLPLGLDYDQVYQVSWTMDGYSEPEDSLKLVNLKRSIKRDIKAVDGVESLSFSNSVSLFSDDSWNTTRDNENGISFRSKILFYEPDVSDVLKLHFVQGRGFRHEDNIPGKRPVVVNQSFVNDFLGDTSVIGLSIPYWDDQDMLVTGVIDHFRYQGEFSVDEPIMLVYMEESDRRSENIYLRVIKDSNASMEAELNSFFLDALNGNDFAINKIDDSRVRQGRRAWVPIAGLLCLALFLGINIAMGLFGILRYNISKRQAEIGLRMAVGAVPQKVNIQFIGEMLILASLALTLGFFFAIQFPLLNFFGVQRSIYLLAIVSSLLIIYALVIICSFIPSQQAARVKPAIALRQE